MKILFSLVATFGNMVGFHHQKSENIDGLVQKRRNSSVLAMELRFFCTNPSIYATQTCCQSWPQDSWEGYGRIIIPCYCVAKISLTYTKKLQVNLQPIPIRTSNK